MKSEYAILNILDRYSLDGNFPFIDWPENPHSFYCLINFWDDVFRAVSGDAATTYRAAQDLEQSPESPVYFIISSDEKKKIRIWPGLTETGTIDVGFFFSRYPDLNKPDSDGRGYSSSLDGVYMLELACDFDKDRVLASAKMLHEFVFSDTSSEKALSSLEESYESRFRRYFPLPDLDFSDGDDED